jgi:hypothetical protein
MAAAIATYGGSPMAKGTATTTGAVGIRLQPNSGRWAVAAGQLVYGSVTLYNASPGDRLLSASIRFYDITGGSLGTQLLTVAAANQVVVAGGSATFVMSGTAPTGTQSVGVNLNRQTGSGDATGDVIYADNVYLSDTVSLFADGNSPNWIWNGTPNASTSTGPPL